MHRASSSIDHRTTMPVAGIVTLHLLPPIGWGIGREPAVVALARPTVPGSPRLRKPTIGCSAVTGSEPASQPQTDSTTDAHFGHRGFLSQTQPEPPGARTRSLSLPAPRLDHYTAKSGLEHRYYLSPDAIRLPLFGGRDGLVQPFRAELGVVQHDGDCFLPFGSGHGAGLGHLRDLQLRSGRAVHLQRVPAAIERPLHRHQHGWPWPGHS